MKPSCCSNQCSENGEMVIKVEATNLLATQRFKDTNKLSEKERARVEKSLEVHRKEYTVKNVFQGRQKLKSIKDTLLPAIIDHINCRFASFVGQIYESISRIIDHHRWDLSDTSAEDKNIKDVADHFSIPLQMKGFKHDHTVLEFKALKKLVKNRYHHLGSGAMWQSVISKYHTTYPNIFLVIELILSIMWASSVVERGFNAATRLFVPSRCSLGKDTVNDLLMLHIDLPVLTRLDQNYEEKLVKKALDSYIPSKYHHAASTASVAKPMQAISVQSEDLFLPEKGIALTDLINPLLKEEDYLNISDYSEDENVSEYGDAGVAGSRDESVTESGDENNISEVSEEDDDSKRSSHHGSDMDNIDSDNDEI